jgi:hypothetical protein
MTAPVDPPHEKERTVHRHSWLTLALALALAAVVLTGCTTTSAGGPSDTPTTVEPASFVMDLAGAATLPAYRSDVAASLNSCSAASSGGWSYLYAGGDPFVTLQLAVYSGVTDGTNPSDFDLDVVAPGGGAVRLVPAGRKEGVQGEGQAAVDRVGDRVMITVDGVSATLEDGASLGGTDVHLTLDCPAT